MKIKTNFTQIVTSVLALMLGLLPVAALAKDGGDDGIKAQSQFQVGVGAAGVKVELRGNATSSVKSEDRGGSEDNNRGGSATSTLVRQDGEHRSDQSLKDDDDDEIDVDHDSAVNATSTVDHPDKVSNRGQLRSFLNHIVKEDGRVADVTVSSTTVETHYSMPAKFLWAIPTNLTAQVSVGSDGSVTITYPWYAFLFSKHGDDLRSAFTQAASSTLATTTATTTLSASVQAHLLNTLFSILKGSK